MKRILISLSAIAIFSLIFVSCYYDNEEALYPALNNTCDTTNVTFSATIVPMLNNSCMTCHSNASTGGSILLNTYAEVVAVAPRITGAIKQLQGYSPMPKNGGKLKSCTITQWDIWVRKGMLND
jgi:hypothetical protein